MEKAFPPCFKAYDIRGKVPEELDNALAEKIGRGLVHIFGVRKVVIGRDVRPSGVGLVDALSRGLQGSGCDVLLLGLCGTEEIYHAAFSKEKDGVDGGVVVTASHNPAEYNGMKIVLRGARPLSGDSGLKDLARYVVTEEPQRVSPALGRLSECSLKNDYIDHLLSYIDGEQLSPLKIVANCGNGCAGPVLDLLEKKLPFSFYRLHDAPDGTFPNGVPNPLLPQNREETAQAVLHQGADVGIAWDGDFDRCFFWDEKGSFVEGYYLVGLLAHEMLRRNPGEKILHDPRLVWNTIDLVKKCGGVPVMTKTGHAFIKERMRLEDALYGGEMSAHHYFKDFGFCDSGMIPWLLVTAVLSRTRKPLSALVSDMVAAYPVSGEINSTVEDADKVLAKIEQLYTDGEKEYTDGLSVMYEDFRFNIRKSNTEPLLRLNVESRGDVRLLREKTAELLRQIRE
ncbi:MAG: phosphomannomutase [Desulfopila sp.]|jgi:phosphomannomutase|nr:phosphomannomutase [Desulfopila sp.]